MAQPALRTDFADRLARRGDEVEDVRGLLLAHADPAAGPAEDSERELQALWTKTRDEVVPLCEGFQFHTGIERTMAFVTATNAYIEKRAPWKLGKSTTPDRKSTRLNSQSH